MLKINRTHSPHQAWIVSSATPVAGRRSAPRRWPWTWRRSAPLPPRRAKRPWNQWVIYREKNLADPVCSLTEDSDSDGGNTWRIYRKCGGWEGLGEYIGYECVDVPCLALVHDCERLTICTCNDRDLCNGAATLSPAIVSTAGKEARFNKDITKICKI